MSARDALNKFCERDAKKVAQKPKRKPYGKPEFEFKKIAKAWLIENGFSVDVVESKAVYSHAAGRYLEGQANAGFSDIVGVTPYFGVAAYIELKAPQKRYTLKWHQHQFLVDKINRFAFAVCVDGIVGGKGDVGLQDTWLTWLDLRKAGKLQESKIYLLMQLPAIKEPTDSFSDLLKQNQP